MEMFNYILPLLLKNWRTKQDIDEQDTVADSAPEKERVVDGVSVREVAEEEATEWEDDKTKCKGDEDEITEWKDLEDGATEWRSVGDEASEWKDVEDDATELKEATEWEDAVAELKDVEDENTKYEEFKGNTKWKGAADKATEYEKVAKDPVHKIGHLICKRVTDKNGTMTRKGQRAWKPLNAVLRGMTLYLQKDTRDLSKAVKAIRVHHAMAYNIVHKKRPNVLCLKTADLRLFYFQAESEEEQASWIATLNCISGFTCSQGNATELEDVEDIAREWTEVAEEEEAMGMDPIHKIGYVICKRVTDENETKTRRSQRAWKPFSAVLQGMVLYLKTDTHDLSKTVSAIRVHHALAYPIEYKKRSHVLCLRTADRRHFFFQTESKEEQASWIATINCIAACYSAPPHAPVSHDKMTHCPQFLPSFTTHLSLEQQLECYTYQFLKISKHLAYYNSLPFREGTLSLGYMLQEVKRYETYVRELQKLVAAKDAGEGCSDLVTGTAVIYKQDNNMHP